MPASTALRALFITTLLLSPCVAGAEESHLTFGEPQPFSFDWLKSEAKRLSKEEFHLPDLPEAKLIDDIDYLKHGKIQFKRDSALWIGSKKQYAVVFFHIGRFFKYAVDVNILQKGVSRELLATKESFQFPEDSPAAQLQSDHRIAGFKIQEDKNGKLDWKTNDFVSFLGASYFRSIGQLFQYGLSARGLAVNVANPNPPYTEEFPLFTKFWIEESGKADTITIYALLESESVTGAYRFDITRKKAVVMEVEAALYVRKEIARLGIAPLTSMFWFSETAKPGIVDWRPEVHDSDGLGMVKGNGEVIWRPLNNPPRLRISSFQDENPKGFGLMQRDRSFWSYVEEGAYERRPSLWVDIHGDWGKGGVVLVELPTDAEDEDNIVAFWVPAEPSQPGEELNLKYRLTWGDQEPNFPNLARCVATRLVREPQKHWEGNMQKFIVEFQGGPLANAPANTQLETDMWTSRGQLENVVIEPLNVDGKILWRVKFTLFGIGNSEPIELRLALKKDGKAVSETWIYQFNP